MFYSKMTMTLYFVLVCSLTTTCLSQYHNICPANGTFSVVHMCKNEVEIGNKGLYLEVFVPSKTNISCRCKVKEVKDQPRPVNINVTKVPATISGSKLYTSQLNNNINFTLSSEQVGTGYSRELNNTGFFINLETSFPSNDVTYCLKINIIQYAGNLSIQCIAPNSSLQDESSTTKSEVISSTTSQSTTTSTTISNVILSATYESSTITTSAMSPGRRSTGSDGNVTSTLNIEGQKERSTLNSFPYAAVGGAVGCIVLIAVVVVVVVVLVMRRRKRNNLHNDHDYYNTGAERNTEQTSELPQVEMIENEIYNMGLHETSLNSPSTLDPSIQQNNEPSENLTPQVEMVENAIYNMGLNNTSVNSPSKLDANVGSETTATSSTAKPQKPEKAVKAKVSGRRDRDDDVISGLSRDLGNEQTEYANEGVCLNEGGVFKAEKPKKKKKEAKREERLNAEPNDLYTVVDKCKKKKNERAAKIAPSGDVYTLVQKPNKSQNKDTES